MCSVRTQVKFHCCEGLVTAERPGPQGMGKAITRTGSGSDALSRHIPPPGAWRTRGRATTPPPRQEGCSQRRLDLSHGSLGLPCLAGQMDHHLDPGEGASSSSWTQAPLVMLTPGPWLHCDGTFGKRRTVRPGLGRMAVGEGFPSVLRL